MYFNSKTCLSSLFSCLSNAYEHQSFHSSYATQETEYCKSLRYDKFRNHCQLKINYCCHALRLQYPRRFSRGWRAFCATATGGKVLLPSTRPYLIYVGLDMRPGMHVVSTLYYPHSPLSVTLSIYSLYQDTHRLRIGQSELTCMLIDDFWNQVCRALYQSRKLENQICIYFLVWVARHLQY